MSVCEKPNGMARRLLSDDDLSASTRSNRETTRCISAEEALAVADKYATSWQMIAGEHDRRAFEANKARGILLLALQLVSTASTLEEAQAVARKYLGQ